MNRLLFNEGGQPVCLDDLKTLQDLMVETIKALVSSLVRTNVFILNEYSLLGFSFDSGRYKTTLSAGTLVVDGDFLPWPETTLTLESPGQPIYICVKNKEEDIRTFEDGQSRNCTQSKEVYVSTDQTGADQAYNLYNLHSMLDLLSSALGIERNNTNVPVTFFNGYSGKVKVVDPGDGTPRQMSIDISTSAENWDTSLGTMAKGMLFRIDDDSIGNVIHGKTTQSFEYNGKKYCLGICAQPLAPIVLLQPEGGFPSNFYDEDYSFPPIPVSFTFKLSEFDKRV